MPALKGNHESLHRAVIEHIDERLEGDLEGAQELTTTDRGHGREEERTYLQLPAAEGLPGRGEWKGRDDAPDDRDLQQEVARISEAELEAGPHADRELAVADPSP